MWTTAADRERDRDRDRDRGDRDRDRERERDRSGRSSAAIPTQKQLRASSGNIKPKKQAHSVPHTAPPSPTPQKPKKSISQEQVGLPPQHNRDYEVDNNNNMMIVRGAPLQKTPKALRGKVPREGRERKSSKRILWVETLSKSLWSQIFAFLDPKSLCMVAMTCREWHQLSNDNELWTQHTISFVMSGGDLFACDGYSKRQYEIDKAMERRGEVSSHKEMMRRRFDTVSYYNAELSMQTSSWLSSLKKPEAKVVIFGLNDAGKTTILYLLQMGEVIQTIPTVGTNNEQMVVDGVTLNMIDVGGKKQLRGLWNVYAGDAELLVWVVDIHDKDRLAKAKRNMSKFIQREIEQPTAKLHEVRAMLVIANKATKRKWDAKRVAHKLGLHELKAFQDDKKRREWLILPCWRMKDTDPAYGCDEEPEKVSKHKPHRRKDGDKRDKDRDKADKKADREREEDGNGESGSAIPRRKSPEARQSEKNLWKGMRWLTHTGFIAAPQATQSSSSSVMSFLGL